MILEIIGKRRIAEVWLTGDRYETICYDITDPTRGHQELRARIRHRLKTNAKRSAERWVARGIGLVILEKT